MRIACWNLRVNSGAEQWPGLFDRLGLDLLFLQESAKPNTDHEYHWQCVQGNNWGSAIVLRSGKIQPLPIPNYDGWVVGGEVLDSPVCALGKQLFAYSLHAPSSCQNVKRSSYINEVDDIIDHISDATPAGCDILIGGDFNFTIGERQPGEFQETKRTEREVVQRIADLGLISCWSASHPNLPLEQTLRWSGDKTQHKATPFHCDGIFVPKRWHDKIACEVFTSFCYQVSDHNPIIAWINE